MNVLVVGANGQIGQHLVAKLQESPKHEPIAMVRKEEQVEEFEKQRVKTVLTDLEGTVDEIAKAAVGADAIVFTAGSGGSTGADKTMLIDFDGAVKSMKAAEKVGITRFILISAIGVQHWHEREHLAWMDRGPHYSAAKHYADVWLENSPLDYTVIRPGGLTNDPGTERVAIAPTLEYDKVPREDVASVVVASLDNPQTIGKSFDLTGGQKTIEEAL